MVKKLYSFLKEPSEIPQQDMMKYMSSTYAGYMTEIKERFVTFKVIKAEYQKNEALFDDKFIGIEIFAIQIRMIMELIVFSISTFEQGVNGKPVSIKDRNKYKPKEIIERHSGLWIKPTHSPNVLINQKEFIFPEIISTKYPEFSVFNTDYGKVGKILHAKQRPRFDPEKQFDVIDLFNIALELEKTITFHFIEKNGQGIFVDTTKPVNDLQVSIRAYTRNK